MTRRIRSSLFAASALTLAWLSPVQATAVFGHNFQLNNVVASGPDVIQLTSVGVGFDRASAFMTTPLHLSPGASFEVKFGFRIDGGTNGADGMTMALFSTGSPGGTGYVGQAGGNLGFYPQAVSPGVPYSFGPAWGLGLDTWPNADYHDRGANNISFLDQLSYYPRGSFTSPVDLNDGNRHFVWMDYDGTDKVVSVFIADADTKPFAPVATDAIDLPAWLGDEAYLAFTAATGGSTNSHFVTALTVARPAPEPGTWLLLAAGLAALSLFSSRRRGWLRD